PKARIEEPEKGAALLEEKRASALPPLPGANKSQRAAVADALELALMDIIPVTDDDFRLLAAERAKAARKHLLQSGKVESERVFLTEGASGAVKSQGSRVYLQLK